MPTAKAGGPGAAPPASNPRPDRLTRRHALSLVALAWLGGMGYVVLRPAPPARLGLAEPRLRPWVEEVLRLDPTLAGSIALEDLPREGQAAPGVAWIGPVNPEPPGATPAVVALSPLVAVVWEESRQRLDLLGDGPVDWPALRRGLEQGTARWAVLPTPETALGADGLLLLALAHYGPRVTALPPQAPDDPALRAWLAPFHPRTVRPRTEERVYLGDWSRQRAGLGDAGLLLEHDALALAQVVQPQARLHLRYPAVSLTRRYALQTPPGSPDGAVLDRLRMLLLSPEAQRALTRHGLRPVAPEAPPGDSLFTTLRAYGARWEAQWAEAQRTDVAERLAREWR